MDNSGMGVYTAGNQFDLDPVMLQSIGFKADEIQALKFIVFNEGKATLSVMTQNYGLPYEQAQKLKYMFDICTGRVVISSEEDLSKHLKKLFGKHQRVGINNLATSRIGDIPRKALVAGIPESSPFKIWNSIKYVNTERMYTVTGVSGQNILIETNRIPQLKYKQPKFIDGVLEIKGGPTEKGILSVAINKKYCKLCNRFVIVASLRRPEFHLGMVEIICIEGTKVYVFADIMEAKQYNRYSNNQRIYDYGYFPFEIQPKLMNCATDIYKRLCGVYALPVAANSDFKVLSDETGETEEELTVE